MNFDIKERLPNFKEKLDSLDKNKRVVIGFSIAAVLILIIGITIVYIQSHKQGIDEELTILKVDGVPVNYSEFKTYLDYAKSIDGLTKVNDQVKKDAINFVLNQKAANKIASQKGITVTKDEYTELLNQEFFLSYCKNISDQTYGEYALSRKLLRYYISQYKPSDNEVQEYYNKNKNDIYTQKPQIKYAQILIRKQDVFGKTFTGDQLLAAQNELKSLQDEIKANPNVDFNALVSKYSEDQYTKDKNGVVGLINEDKIDSQLLNTIKQMKVGEISKPVENFIGFYVVKVLERQQEYIKPLNDVKSNVIKNLQQINGRNNYYSDIDNFRKNNMNVDIDQEALKSIV